MNPDDRCITARAFFLWHNMGFEDWEFRKDEQTGDIFTESLVFGVYFSTWWISGKDLPAISS